MLARFTKSPPAANADLLTFVREDGTETSHELPRQGVLPHEAIRLVVETAFDWRDGWLSEVAAGLSEKATTLHAQQSEILATCLESELWGGGSELTSFERKLAATARRFSVAPPSLTADELRHVREALRAFGAAWRPLAPGKSIERPF